jgi:small-conductance mechanosensitive channel
MRWWERLEPLSAAVSLDKVVLGNSLIAWIVAFAAAAVVVVVMQFLKRLVIKRIGELDESSGADWRLAWRGLASATKFWFRLLLGIYVASLLLDVPPKGQRAIQSLTAVAFLLQFGLWGNVVVHVLSQRWTRGRLRSDPSGVMMTWAVTFASRIVLWSIIVLLVLENVGVEVTALITGLGIGGVAVALAAQNILGDLFASLSIVVDRPFLLGDFIIVGDLSGTVEQIGLKTTRLRALTGEQLVFPNAGLMQSRIRNTTRSGDRRVTFGLNVIADTPAAKLAAIPAMLREIVEREQPIRFDRAHFAAISDSAMKFEVVYVVLSPDYGLYMDIQQRINLEILNRLEAEEIKLASTAPTFSLKPPDPTSTGGAPPDGALPKSLERDPPAT